MTLDALASYQEMFNYVILIVFIIILSGNGHRQEMQKIARRTYNLSHTSLHMIKN